MNVDICLSYIAGFLTACVGWIWFTRTASNLEQERSEFKFDAESSISQGDITVEQALENLLKPAQIRTKTTETGKGDKTASV